MRVAQQVQPTDANVKPEDYLNPLQEGDGDVGDAAEVQSEDGSVAHKVAKVVAGTDAEIEKALRESETVLVSSAESELASKAGAVAFKTAEGFVTLGKASLSSGLAALGKSDLDAAVEKAMLKAEAEGHKNAVQLLSDAINKAEAKDTVQPFPKGIQHFKDTSLALYAKVLEDLKLPVLEKTAEQMKLIMENSSHDEFHEKITLESAAFLATVGTQGEIETQAALEILDGTKTDTLVKQLLSVLEEAKTPQLRSPDLLVLNREVTAPESAIAEASQKMQSLSASKIGISEILTLLTASAEVESTKDFTITTRNANLQNTNPQSASPQSSVAANRLDTPQYAVNQQEPSVPNRVEIPQIPITADTPQNIIVKPEHSTLTRTTFPQLSGIEAGLMDASLPVQDALAAALAEVPGFRDTPPRYILRFSEMLTRVAGSENTVAERPSIENLHEQIERLFTDIDRNDPNLGQRLSQAKEELFLRLSLIEESISHLDTPRKEAALEQTQRLVSHVRVMNSIDHIVYMHLPVIINEKATTAELYVFKKKGGKQRIDPENVNILLAIELEHMGKWEGLINIKGKDVTVKMEVQGEEEKRLFGSNIVALHKLLHEIGFKLQAPVITHGGERRTPLNAMLSFEHLRVGQKSMIKIGQSTMDFMA
jgi:hypothetical protein